MANPLYGQNKADGEIDKASGALQSLLASDTLVAGDSGGVILFTPPASAGALVITLPAHSPGLEFTIVQASAYDTAACTIESVDGNDFLGNIDAQTGAGDNSAGTDDKISFGSGTVAGDYVKIVSDGSQWVVVGSCSKVTTNGVVFA